MPVCGFGEFRAVQRERSYEAKLVLSEGKAHYGKPICPLKHVESSQTVESNKNQYNLARYRCRAKRKALICGPFTLWVLGYMQNKNRTEHKNKCKEKGGGETHATSTAAGVLAAGRKGGARKAGAGVGSGGRVGRSARDGDPSKLDIRVGVIVKAWKHPDSDKLYCDEVDLGEVQYTTFKIFCFKI